MSIIIEEDVIDTISGDDWAEIIAKDREAVRRELDAKIREFQRNGGKINKIKQGDTANGVSAYWSFPIGKALAGGRQIGLKEMQDKARERAISTVRGDQESDAVLTAKLDTLLNTVKTGTELSLKMGVCPDLVNRLIVQYFPDDARAETFRKRNRTERADMYEAIMMPRIRQAILGGMNVIYAIAKHCGASHRYVSAMNKKHKLNIAKGPGGRPPLEGVPSGKRKYKPRTRCLNPVCSEKVNALSFFCQACGHITAKGQNKEEA